MNAPTRQGIPLRPDRTAVGREQARSVRRGIAALVLTASATTRVDPEGYLRRHWPEDALAGRILKAATAPASTTTSGLPAISPLTAFRALAPSSGALKLFEAGLIVDLRRFTTLRIPYVTMMPGGSFVGEGQPGPVIDLAMGAAVVGPMKKLLVLAGISEELQEASSPDQASDVIGGILADATMKTFDAVALGTGAGDSATPAGLLNGVTPITAAPAGATAMSEDLGALAASIAAAYIDTEGLIFVASPRLAIVIKVNASPKFDNLVLSSPAIPDKSVAAFAPAAIISAFGDLPAVETSVDATVNFNTAPATDGTLGAPTYSAWQQRMIALRVSARAAWTLVPGGAAVINAVNW